MITIQSGLPLHVNLPPMYRFMDSKYVTRFFEFGEIRLSTFNKFKTYPDEIRGDKKEGHTAVISKTKEGSTYMLSTNVGSSELVLCTSLYNNSNTLDAFKTDGGIKINDPLGFAAAIAKAISGCEKAFLGFCNYQDHRLINKNLEAFSFDEFTNEDGHFIIGGPNMSMRNNQMIGNGIDIMFLKEKKYEMQAEFRFIWSVNQKFYELNPTENIICKEAIQFCEIIE